MSRKGNCWDNAPAEAFFKSIKTEWIYGKSFRSIKQTQIAVFEYIETFYNNNRKHKIFANKDVRDMIRVNTPTGDMIVVANNHDTLEIFMEK